MIFAGGVDAVEGQLRCFPQNVSEGGIAQISAQTSQASNSFADSDSWPELNQAGFALHAAHVVVSHRTRFRFKRKQEGLALLERLL